MGRGKLLCIEQGETPGGGWRGGEDKLGVGGWADHQDPRQGAAYHPLHFSRVLHKSQNTGGSRLARGNGGGTSPVPGSRAQLPSEGGAGWRLTPGFCSYRDLDSGPVGRSHRVYLVFGTLRRPHSHNRPRSVAPGRDRLGGPRASTRRPQLATARCQTSSNLVA